SRGQRLRNHLRHKSALPGSNLYPSAIPIRSAITVGIRPILRASHPSENINNMVFNPPPSPDNNCMVGMLRDLSRRQLFGLVAAASVALLAACASPPAPTGQSHTSFQPTLNAPDDLEMPDVTVGFVPITCSSPIVNAAALNIYHQYGLNVML